MVCKVQMLVFSSIILLCSINFSSGELTLRSVSEGQCISPRPYPLNLNTELILELARRFRVPFYFPMGSKHMYRSYAKIFLGRLPKSQEELNEMKLRVRYSFALIQGYTGFSNERFNQICVPSLSYPFTISRGTCYIGLIDEQVEQSTVVDTLVWTDNQSALFVRCVDGKEKDWKVISFFPTLTDDVKRQVLSKITGLGFNPSLVEYVKY